MKRSRFLLSTLKETPKEAQVISHQLMLRAGMIKQLASGIYSYLPLGLRSIRKIENIIREELNAVGCVELLMPAVQPAELWIESGRWKNYGKELLRIRDRKDNDFCFGPTHEEVVTDIVRREVRSYRDLPLNLYQIQTKFRDEIRPRFGLMRGREFIMKDAYSFDLDEETSTATYWVMYEAYKRIFTRCGLGFRPVEADSGAIGGHFTHEFHVLADSGEDEILSCSACEYAANVEKCEFHVNADVDAPQQAGEPGSVSTPGKKTMEEVSSFLSVPLASCIKSLLYQVDDAVVLVAVPGDRAVNEVAVKNLFAAETCELVEDPAVSQALGLKPGFLGPLNLPDGVTCVVDHEVFGMHGAVCGANVEDTHLVDVEPWLHLKGFRRERLRLAQVGDTCPRCKSGTFSSHRGIEVGQVFKLGTKYSESMGATYLDDQGEARPIVMGCYGIGVGRSMAAAIEQNHDEAGIIWPVQIAPFHVSILNLDINDALSIQTSDALMGELEGAGIEVLLDDREERPGFKFKDSDLIGIPIQVIVGKRALKQGQVDLKIRKTGERTSVPVAHARDAVLTALESLGLERLAK